MSGQPIRPSQFILTFGVGSIIETPEGPRIIGDFDKWGNIFRPRYKPDVSDFQITSSEASELLDNGLIFRIPTNVDLGKKDNEIIFKTIPFPEWSLCENHNTLSKMINDVSQCSECKREGRNISGRKEAIRFVRVCKAGHLDDVDWYGVVHDYKERSCNSKEFSWEPIGGNSLKDIYITCKKCGKRIRLQDVYNKSYKCSGRFPERDSHGDTCKEKSRVVLRGTTILRIPELITTITIPPRETRIHRIFETIQMRTILSTQNSWTKEELLDKLRQISSRNSTIVDPRIIEVLENNSEENIIEAIDDTNNINRIVNNIQDVKNEEIKALVHAAKYGHPPNPENANPDLDFQVNIQDVREKVEWKSETGKTLSVRVTPIERLRVVIVQKGYRRLGTDNTHKLIQTFYNDGNNKWYPGIELLGEGIFIDKPEGINLSGNEMKDWSDIFEKSKDVVNHPTAVWWHTFSHRIIKALSLDSGYSSASIRERTYVSLDPDKEKIESGILLYTAQTGSDGTLGGLIDQVPHFENILESACEDIDFCSNDPLCSEEKINANKNNGAACYACLFLSETSCEYSNKYLDRNLLRGNLK